MNFKIIEFFSKNAFFSFNTAIEKKVYESLVDRVFYKSLLSIWTSLGVGILVYAGLLFYEHDWKLHIWLFIFFVFYFFRFLVYFIYFKGNIVSDEFKQRRHHSLHIIFWGALTGLMWVLLLLIVKDYSVEAKIFSIFPLILFSIGIQVRYSLLPLWYISYIFVVSIPLCCWLFYQGGSFIVWGFGVLLYTFYTTVVAASYFKFHLESLLFQFKNEKLIVQLQSSKKKIEKINKDLNQKNNELIGEIKQRHRVEKKLEKSATHDQLTGLPNRLLLKDRVNQAILASKRKKSFFAILFIDLDQFKSINDTFGHEWGDKILQAVAMRLKKTLREEDTIARIGGDEFVVLIPHLERAEDVYPIIQKIIIAFSEAYIVRNQSLMCTASIGLAVFPSGGSTFASLIRNADMAMYQAKHQGGARFASYTI